MTRTIKTKAVVDAGRRVQIESTELIPGTTVDVIVLQTDDERLPSINELIASYPGGQVFQSAEDVDAFFRSERDAWDR